MANFTHIEIDNMFSNFKQQMLFLRLVNSGQSNLSDKQDVLVKQAFDLAFVLLTYSFNKQNIHLFNRVYNSAKELVPGEYIKSVMKHPEMYEKMKQAKEQFFAQADGMSAKLIKIASNAGHIH